MSAEDHVHEDHEDIEDLEVCAREGREPRCVRRYRIRIDKEHFIVRVTYMTARQLLELAGKCDPTKWMLSQKLCGGKLVRIGPDDTVSFVQRGIERFITLPLDQTEGLSLRREFDLPMNDVTFLNSTERPWETVVENGVQWVLVHDFCVPNGYGTTSTTAAVRVEPNYDDVQLDMIYFSPALSRVDGKTINATSRQRIVGQNFQRWSRHRTRQNPWRPGVDNLSTHLALVGHWLSREFAEARP